MSSSSKLRLNILTAKSQKTTMLVTPSALPDLAALQALIQTHCKNKLGTKGKLDVFTLVSGKTLELADLQNDLTICVAAASQQQQAPSHTFDISKRTLQRDPAAAACCAACQIRIIGEEFSSPELIASLSRFAQMPGVVSILALPDLSAAVPCPVGTSITVRNKIYPSWIGTDIGCGVSLFKLPATVSDKNVEKLLQRLASQYTDKWNLDEARQYREEHMATQEEEEEVNLSKHDDTFGSIGAGNHFCELQECRETGECFLAVHSGSRSLGVDLAQRIAEIGGENAESIAHCLRLQRVGMEWAKLNRRAIAKRVLNIIFPNQPSSGLELDLLVLDICHNFVEQSMAAAEEVYIHRKGAIPTNAGPVLIPGSRGTNSYLVQAQNETINSLPHGAGRRFTKADAEKKFSTQAMHQAQQRHVLCNDKKLLAQEAPGAYKDIDDIMQHLVEKEHIVILRVLRPLLTIKYNGI